MVELHTKMQKSGLVYIPKELQEAFSPELRIIPNAVAALIFTQRATYEDVLTSLDLIAAEIRHRITLQKRKK